MKNILFTTALGFGLFKLVTYVGNKIHAAKNLTAELVGVKLGKLSFPQLSLTLTVEVDNPTATEVTANKITGTLNAPNGNQLGSFETSLLHAVANGTGRPQMLGIVVPANANTKIEVSANIDLLTTTSSILTTGLQATLNAIVETNGLLIPLRSKIYFNQDGLQMSGCNTCNN